MTHNMKTDADWESSCTSSLTDENNRGAVDVSEETRLTEALNMTLSSG